MTSGGRAPTWPTVLTALMSGTDLSAADTSWAMDEIMAGAATPAQLAAFAVLLRAKGETAEELGGLVASMRDNAVPVPIDGPAVDVVGTGADRAHTVNISTMAALVVAGSGRRVVKHGNRAASSACGSADVLEELGVVIDLPADGVLATVAEVGIGFCFARVFHPGMRHAGPTAELALDLRRATAGDRLLQLGDLFAHLCENWRRSGPVEAHLLRLSFAPCARAAAPESRGQAIEQRGRRRRAALLRALDFIPFHQHRGGGLRALRPENSQAKRGGLVRRSAVGRIGPDRGTTRVGVQLRDADDDGVSWRDGPFAEFGEADAWTCRPVASMTVRVR